MKTLILVLLVTVLAMTCSVAGEPEKKEAKEEKKQEKQEVVTNETLKKKYGEPAPAPAVPGKEAQQEKVSPKKDQPAAVSPGKDHAARIVELKQEEVRLNKRIRSLKNPFLPKVPQTDEEKKAEEGKGSDERVRMLEKRLVVIGDELSRLQEPPGRSS